LDPEARGALPVYAEGTALAAAGASLLFPPLALLVLGGLGALLVKGAAAKARSTQGCGSCGEEARRRRHRRDEAGDARAGDRDGPGPGHGDARRARDPGRRLRRRVPVRHAGLRASIATGVGPDRHHIPSRRSISV
jgi:hypothetical protein